MFNDPVKTILVTGGAGAIGSRLVTRLSATHKVLVLDDLSSGWLENIRGLPIQFWRGSVTDDEMLKEVFSQKPQIVLHLAANFANQNSVDYPQKDLAVNGLGTLKILQYARDTKVERFVYTSSSCIYGNERGAISENVSKFSLDTPYAVTKLLGEQYVRFFREHHDMATVILRLFNSYGPGEYPGKYRNVIPNFVHRALQGKPLNIYGTGDETRDYTFIDDTVSAIILAMESPAAVGKTFNTGTGTETSTKVLAEKIKALCGSKSAIEYQPRRGWDSVDRRCSDISLIRSTLGYKTTTELDAGLKATVEWFREKNLAHFIPA